MRWSERLLQFILFLCSFVSSTVARMVGIHRLSTPPNVTLWGKRPWLGKMPKTTVELWDQILTWHRFYLPSKRMKLTVLSKFICVSITLTRDTVFWEIVEHATRNIPSCALWALKRRVCLVCTWPMMLKNGLSSLFYQMEMRTHFAVSSIFLSEFCTSRWNLDAFSLFPTFGDWAASVVLRKKAILVQGLV
jgi:hypothetical protein